ncbi:MAG: PorP/SprF family type IX secretion system membrane protein [Bacteroidota bacterium]
MSSRQHTILILFSLTLMSALTTGRMEAQQLPQWTQYLQNKYAINPAYAGLDKSVSVTAGIRSQWTQLPGAPKTQVINAHVPLYFLSGAMGVSIANDETGPLRRTSAMVSYNFVYDTPFGLFSFGASLGGQQVNLNGSALRTPDGIYVDNSIDHQDPRLLAGTATGFQPIWTLGAYYVRDLLEVGLSIDRFPNLGAEAGSTTFTNSSSVSLMASYQYPLNEAITIEPNVLLKTDGVVTQVDLGILGYYERLIGGLSLRGYGQNSIDALGILAGTKVSKHVRISYSFDIGLSGLGVVQDGTHEFVVNYNLNKPIRTGELPKIIYNPRFR